MNPMNMLFSAFRSRGINLPSNINTSDPNQILQYLMNNGIVSQDQYNRAYQTYRNMYGNGMNNSQQNK